MNQTKLIPLLAPLGMILVVILTSLLILFVICGAILSPAAVQETDFTNFFAAGWAVKENRSADLYPGQLHFSEAPFSKLAHQIAPLLPNSSIPFFQYPPLVAYIFQSFAHLPVHLAFIVWQIISLFSFALACKTLAVSHKGLWQKFFFCSLLFLPLAHIVIIGQIGIVTIILPIALSYFLALRNKEFLSGLCLSIFAVKPLIFVPAIIIVASKTSKGQWKYA